MVREEWSFSLLLLVDSGVFVLNEWVGWWVLWVTRNNYIDDKGHGRKSNGHQGLREGKTSCRTLTWHQLSGNRSSRRINGLSQGKTVQISTDSVSVIETKFDEAIAKEQTQRDMFNLFHDYLPKVPEGYNLTVFAYGQTGSGKTYTMFGSDW